MTELTWEGKYKDGKKVTPVRIALPFQTIETVNESAEDRKRTIDMFAQQANQNSTNKEWRNRLIWGDKKYVLPSLLPEFAGKVNLIYIDPPFNVGSDFSFTATIADHPDTEYDETTQFVKEPSIIEQKAYRDTWGKGLDSYMQWFYETALLLKELLAEDGSIYVHLDWHVIHYAKVIFDEVFGYDNFVNEIIWKRKAAQAWKSDQFGTTNDTLLLYVKTNSDYTFNHLYSKEDENTKKYLAERFVFADEDGRKFMKSPLINPLLRKNLKYEFEGVQPPPNGWLYSKERMTELFKKNELVMPEKEGGRIYRKIYEDQYEGQMIQNIWTDIPIVNPMAKERLEYSTQKPEALLERIIKASSNEGDLILDSFCGSGTTAAVAEKLNRRWITCDLGRFAIHTTRKRLLGIEGVKPFIVQNLGKYERQQWMKSEWGNVDASHSLSMTKIIEQEKSYKHFIIELYHAKPLDGYTWLHGAKAGRMIHVGSVEAPVTVEDIKSAIKEFWKLVGKRLNHDSLDSKISMRSLNQDSQDSKNTKIKKKGSTDDQVNPEIKEIRVQTNGIDFLGWDFAFDVNETAKQFAAENKVNISFKKIPREVLEKKAVEQGDIKFYELASLNIKTKKTKKNISLTLDNFTIPPDDVPEEVQGKITHWSQWIDYWAVDWNYRDDTFHNEWQSYRTKQKSNIELSTSKEYEEPGKYTVLVKVIDILGNDTTKAINVEL